jgi:hypothetical protein
MWTTGIRAAHNPTHPAYPSPGIYPWPLQNFIGLESPDSSGVTGISCCAPHGPILFSTSTIISPASSKGVPKRPDLILAFPPATPAISYSHQSDQSMESLAQGYTLPMPWPVCSSMGPDGQRGRCTGDYPGWLLYCPKRTFLDSEAGVCLRPKCPILRPFGYDMVNVRFRS